MAVRTFAEDIADYLISRGLATAKGTDIHQSMMEDEPANGILIREGGGQGASRTLDGRRILNPGIMIIVRRQADQYNAGYELAHLIYDAMLDLANTGIEGRAYIGLVPLGDISELGRDERDRWKWSMNFVVRTV
jgi:hypothetical protein